MAKKRKKASISNNNILNCVVYAVIGILLLVLKAGSLGILMTAVGALLIVMGLMDILNEKDFTKGAIEMALGLAIIICGWVIADIVLLIFGIVLIVKGALELFKNLKKGFVANLSSIVLIVIGVLLVVAKWAFMDVMCTIAGVIFLINAVLALFGKKLG